MIKSFEINNFQSHKKSVIEFDKNVTAIIGLNNHGKSAVLKALRKAIRNDPNGNVFIRNIPDIAKTSNLIVNTDKGSIKRIIGRGSSAEDNIYEVNTIEGERFEYTKFSKTGIPKEVIDVSDISLPQMFGNEEYDLNFQKQRDNIFLVTGKGLSSIRSKVLSKITGVDQAQRAIQIGKLKEKNLTQEINKNRKDREDLNKDLEKYEELNEIVVNVESLQKSIKYLREIEGDIEYYKESFDGLTNILKRARNLKNISTTLNISFDLTYIREVKNKLNLLKKFNEVVVKENWLLRKEGSLSKQIDINKIIRVFNQIVLLRNIEQLKKKTDRLNNAYNIKIISFDKINKVRDNLQVLQEYLMECNNIIKSANYKEENLIDTNNNYQESLSELISFRKELGVCPICNKPFEE